jgi:hypothetical protein
MLEGSSGIWEYPKLIKEAGKYYIMLQDDTEFIVVENYEHSQ